MENFQDRGVWIRIRFVLRGWIRIRSISDRIRNPDPDSRKNSQHYIRAIFSEQPEFYQNNVIVQLMMQT